MFVTKTITPEARRGNPPVRIAETDHGMLELDRPAGTGDRRLRRGPSAAARRAGDEALGLCRRLLRRRFRLCCERLEGDERVAAIELNLSCPNVEEAPETAAELVAAARSATSKTLYAKLSPAQWDVAAAARAVVEIGADGLSLVNTIRGLATDPLTLEPRLALGVGGYSGPALKPIALACVHACSAAVDVPIVGMGGVWSGLDALELVAAGASAVALGTVLFADPARPAPDPGRARGRSVRPRLRHTAGTGQVGVVEIEKTLQTSKNGTA